jgi:hypothetical protein
MMVGKPEFDFVASLRDTAVAGLTWGDPFVLAPRVKRDVACQLVQERTRASRDKQKVQRSVSFVEDVTECCHVEASRQVAWPTAMGIGRALAEHPAAVTTFYTIGNINMVSRQKKVDEEDLVEALLAEEMWARVRDGVEAEKMRRKESEEMRRKEVREEKLRKRWARWLDSGWYWWYWCGGFV